VATALATALATAVATAVPTGVAAAVPPATAGARPPVPSATPAGGDGSYAVIDAAGAVITYGQAGFHGDLLADHLDAPIVGAARSSGGGYWMVASDGGVFAFGGASFHGSMGGTHLNRPVVGMASSPDGRGYWLVASDGGVFAFGGASFHGSMGGTHLNRPVVGMASSPDGRGYWLVAADGGVFAFGDAAFDGSTGSLTLNRPIVGMQAATSGHGYRLVAADGGVFSFGSVPFDGSLGGHPPATPIVGLTATPDGGGYWMVGRNDSVYAFGDAVDNGGAVSPLHPPLYPSLLAPALPAAVAIVALPPGPQATHAGAVRVDFVGDSLGWYEGYDTSNLYPPYVVDNGAAPGCGITNGAPLREWSHPGRTVPDFPACPLWAAQMAWVTRRDHPDAVVVQVGFWESQIRLFGGAMVNLSDPAYAAYIQANLEQAVDLVHAGGAAVILATAPYYGDGTPAWAVDDFNAIVAAVARRDAADVSVLDVNRLLDPTGRYTTVVNGLTVRTPDRVHLTADGVQRVIDPVLTPMVIRLGGAVYRGNA
jgi:hypothetical protein